MVLDRKLLLVLNILSIKIQITNIKYNLQNADIQILNIL